MLHVSAAPIRIRPYEARDATAVTDIFYDAIHSVATQYYSPAQVQAWAPLPKDYAMWRQRLRAKPPLVALISAQIVGFTTLEADGHIDWTYTHPQHQRRGVSSALYAELQSRARQQGITRLYVEASYLARPFFAKQGFVTLRRNEVPRNGETLTNWSMEKRLVDGGLLADGSPQASGATSTARP